MKLPLFADMFLPRVKCSREKLLLALDIELFCVDDKKFMDMFATPGALDTIQNESWSLRRSQMSLMSCLDKFKHISQALLWSFRSFSARIHEHELNEAWGCFYCSCVFFVNPILMYPL